MLEETVKAEGSEYLEGYDGATQFFLCAHANLHSFRLFRHELSAFPSGSQVVVLRAQVIAGREKFRVVNFSLMEQFRCRSMANG